MGSLQFPNMGMGLRLAAFGRRSSAIIILIKSIFRSVIVLVDVVVNQVESQYELYNVSATRAERLENLFTNVCVRVHPGLQKCIVILRLGNLSLSLNPLRHLVKVY